jgi:N,N'-diacetyllegionaminate synthase
MKPVFLIAEAGVNHNGSLARAKKLVDAAAEAGADAVKFQTFAAAENVMAKSAGKAPYQKQATGAVESVFDMVRKLYLSFDEFTALRAHCRKRGILFLSTPFDDESVDFLHRLGMPIFKIPSGEVTNLPYLRRIGKFKKRVVMSTGMATLDEIGAALQALARAGTPRSKVTVLHCNTSYPTPFKDANLRAMGTIAERFGVAVGYSDHTLGIEASLAAAALGAAVIEKHFTTDKTLPGPDQSMSLDPTELKAWVAGIRAVSAALGSASKTVTSSEKANVKFGRRSIVAKRAIRKGEKFSAENLAAKRPGTGLSPMHWDKLIGKRAKRDYAEDDFLRLP